MNFVCEHWEALASLLLSAVAIGIAIYSSRQTSKDATRQIESIKELNRQTIENTTKEVESIKELARLQINATIKQVELEIEKAQLWVRQATQEAEGISNIQNGHFAHLTDAHDMMMQRFNEERPIREMELYRGFVQRLNDILKNLKGIKVE